MAMIESSNTLDFSRRPRRVQQSSAKSYDGEGARNLELKGILDVLSAYKGYEGGINCCKCGKLYKSKVCFIKHLWEHSIYWEVFPDDKNHERVLAIQAALILYSSVLGVSQKDAERLRDLLVTAPSVHETTLTLNITTKKGQQRTLPVPTTPQKSHSENVLSTDHATLYPETPQKDFDHVPVCPNAPRKDKRKSVHCRIQRLSKKRRRLLLE